MIKRIISIAAAAAAIGAGAAILIKKGSGKADAAVPARKKQDPVPKPQSSTRERISDENKATGSYSFLAGVENAVPVELSLKYDSERFSYSILSESFPAFTNAEEVAFVMGEDVSIQIEYADIYDGSGFEAAMNALKEKYRGFEPVSYGEHKAYKYINGDCMCIALPIAGIDNCYVLATLIKEHKCDVDFTELPDNIDVIEMLSSVKTAL